MATATTQETRGPPPNQSIYIQNLPEKLQKEDLRRALYMLLSTYGRVLDVTAMKTPKMRGQAHVLFQDVQGATQAMRNCQGFEFFGREMRISYSKNRSNTLAKLTGMSNQPNTTTEGQRQALQSQSSFPAPPGTVRPLPGSLPPPPGSLGLPPAGLPAQSALPPKPNGNAALKVSSQQPHDVPSPQGTKRAREESDDEASMDEDDDGEGEMDLSDDD